jgi:hypothetical protein
MSLDPRQGRVAVKGKRDVFPKVAARLIIG